MLGWAVAEAGETVNEALGWVVPATAAVVVPDEPWAPMAGEALAHLPPEVMAVLSRAAAATPTVEDKPRALPALVREKELARLAAATTHALCWPAAAT
ncbi:UNVERIFIED_CONTAM: hypothetical protein K2H54_052919 [Gekko kuhli]